MKITEQTFIDHQLKSLGRSVDKIGSESFKLAQQYSSQENNSIELTLKQVGDIYNSLPKNIWSYLRDGGCRDYTVVVRYDPIISIYSEWYGNESMCHVREIRFTINEHDDPEPYWYPLTNIIIKVK